MNKHVLFLYEVTLVSYQKKQTQLVSVMTSSRLSSPEISPTPKQAKSSMGHQLQLSFPSEELRVGFLAQMESVKQRLFPCKSVDNAKFMNFVLAKLDRLESQSGDATEQQKDNLPSTSILDSSG